jgi:hypothetical protein
MQTPKFDIDEVVIYKTSQSIEYYKVIWRIYYKDSDRYDYILSNWSRLWEKFLQKTSQSSSESEDELNTTEQDFWWIKKIADSYIQEFMVQFDNWRKPRSEVKDKVLTKIINDNS